MQDPPVGVGGEGCSGDVCGQCREGEQGVLALDQEA